MVVVLGKPCLIIPLFLFFQNQLLRFEETGGNRRAWEYLTEKYGAWPEERAAADRAALHRLIEAHHEFLATGFYPWDKKPLK